MTKKNLSNLIQEESTKFTPFPDEPIIEIIAEAVLEPKVQTPEAPISATKNHSEVQAIQKESNLTKQISDLQIAVSEKEALAERLTQELDETKQTALQLADSNFQLLEEIKFLKQPYQQPSPQSSQISKSIQYKKSHRSIERLQEKPSQDSEDFSKNTWLYD
jgi:hypothetical protein